MFSSRFLSLAMTQFRSSLTRVLNQFRNISWNYDVKNKYPEMLDRGQNKVGSERKKWRAHSCAV